MCDPDQQPALADVYVQLAERQDTDSSGEIRIDYTAHSQSVTVEELNAMTRARLEKDEVEAEALKELVGLWVHRPADTDRRVDDALRRIGVDPSDVDEPDDEGP